MRIAVIGGGILGASVAWHLGQGGGDVTVFAAPRPGATDGSFAWINASWGNDATYRRLRMAAMARWPDLAAKVPGTSYRRCGGLLWDLPEADLRAYADEAAAQGYALQVMDRDAVKRHEPALLTPPDLALFAPDEGMAEPAEAAAALLAASGAKVLRLEAAPVETRGRAAVLAEGGVHPFDAVVLAAGCDCATLLVPLGIVLAMQAPRGLIARSQPVAPRLKGLLMMPDLHLRQTAGGAFALGDDYAGTDPGPGAEAAARVLIDLASARLAGPPLAYAGHSLAARPMPGDGHPAVGALALPGLFLALSHSGITLAPAIGALLAGEILTGAVDPLIAPYRPGRLVQSA